MKSITKSGWHLLLGCILVITSAASVARAQQPSPSPGTAKQTTTQPPATTSDDALGGYNITSSIEVGVRGLQVGGNNNQYRSDLNYKPGVRVFDSSFLLRKKEGERGGLFDEFLVNSSGWGGDPQGYARVSVEKTGIYRFDANIRRFKYFNNLANLALGQHTKDTRMQFGDYDLTIFPENQTARFYLGYSRDSETGPGTTTYDYSRDEFQISSSEQSRANNWRFGADAKVGPVNISFLQGLRYFRDDSTYSSALNPGNNTTNTSRIDTLFRQMPTTGHHYFTRFSAQTFLAKKLDITARFIYTSSTSNFSFLETVTGRSGVSPGNIINLERFTTSGQVKRPYGMGDLGVTFIATDKLRISDTFRFDNFRINGGDVLADFLMQSTVAGAALPNSTTNTLFLRTTNYRRIMNTVEADYQFTSHFAAHVGYRYTDRHIRLFQFNQGIATPSPDESFTNKTNSVIFGFKARPKAGWNIFFDGEHGTADSVFTRVENDRYTNLRVRNRYDLNSKISFNVSAVIRNNSNPSEVLLSDTQLPTATAPNSLDVSVRSRTFSTSVDWTPNQKVSLSTGYTHLRVTSDAGIILFLNNVSQFGRSQYFMRDNFFYINAFVHPIPRVTLFASYRINKDPGQGSLVSTDPTLVLGSYPMSFQAPEVRASFRINRRADLNLGYQYYNYRDVFFPAQNYHANLPYISLRIYFRGREQ